MKFLILALSLLFLVGCKKEIETEVEILEKSPFYVKTLEREKIKLPQGKMKGQLV
jgi:hypothetical protein